MANWKCGKCGYSFEADTPPDTCPSCKEKWEFMDNTCYSFLAEELVRVQDPSLDELEALQVLEVPVDELEERIGEEPYLNSMTAVALFWYLRHRRQ